MPEFTWQGFNQTDGGKPTNSLLHSTSLIHPQTPSLLCSGGGRCPVGEENPQNPNQQPSVCNYFVKNHTF